MNRRTRTLVFVGALALIFSASIGSWVNALDDVSQLTFCNAHHPSVPPARPAQHRAISSASTGLHFSPELAQFDRSSAAISHTASTHAIAIDHEWHPDGARRLSLIATLRI